MRRAWLLLLWTALAAGCRDSPSAPRGGVDLDDLFRPPTAAEIAAVEAAWAARQPTAHAVVEETSALMLMAGGFGTARVFSHLVDGHRHYGATLAPVGAAAGSLPVVVFAHGGDSGIQVSDLALVTILLGEAARDFVYVMPAFRSEPLTLGASVFTAQGEPSPWDRDVDDALALLDVVLEHVAEADPGRIGVIGGSRGGMVGLLMAIREPRIDRVAILAAPTTLFSPWFRGLTADALRGELRPLPVLHVLNDRFIQPLARGEIGRAEFRHEMVRRSPVLWADRLPPVQLHHGTADDVVPVEQADSLIAALQRLGRDVGDQFFLYPGIGHDVFAGAGIDARILDFLHRLRQTGQGAAADGSEPARR
jgi:dipeptidyl aminopeptidase/acylaminoacyl peptidase